MNGPSFTHHCPHGPVLLTRVAVICLGLLSLSFLLLSREDAATPISKKLKRELIADPRGSTPFIRRWMHLDLKGAPPRVEYLERVFSLVSSLGVSGIVIEWEDSFPWTGALRQIRAPHAYSRGDIDRILNMAADSSLQVVPLIQSFGHLEFVLKHGKWIHLRERLSEDSAICPSRNETIDLLREMMKQMRLAHPAATTIHIGGDEAYFVGEDAECRQRLQSIYNHTIDRLKVDHIARVARSALSIGFTRVLAWNDMFDKTPVSILKEFELGRLLTPVVWGYASDVTVDEYFPHGLFSRLSKVFPTIWFASAFKGANGKSNPFLSIDRYLSNQQSYVQLFKNVHHDLQTTKVDGIILTGWSRFSHHSPLCELLPIAIPSLVLNLVYLQDVKLPLKEVTQETKRHLDCPSNPPRDLFTYRTFLGDTFYASRETVFTPCSFPEKDLFAAVQELRFLKWKFSKLPAENEKEWQVLMKEVKEMESKLRPLLSLFVFQPAVEEFFSTHVRPLAIPSPHTIPS